MEARRALSEALDKKIYTLTVGLHYLEQVRQNLWFKAEILKLSTALLTCTWNWSKNTGDSSDDARHPVEGQLAVVEAGG